MLRILISTTPNIYFNVTGFTLSLPSYNIAKLGAMIRENHDVRLLDNNRFLTKPHDLWTYLRIFKPEVFAFSCPTPGYNKILFELVEEIKEKYPDMYLIAGGQTPTYHYEEFLNNRFDYIILYEGEETLKELSDFLDGTGKRDLHEIEGIAYKEKGQIKKNRLRPYIKDLDSLPIAARELLDYTISLGGVGNFTLIEGSRGCQYHCKFCTQPDLWKDVRVFSNRHIIREMKILKEQGYKELLFTDDSVVGEGDVPNSVEKITELFELMIQEQLGFVFGMSFRAESVAKHPDLIALGARAGLLFAVVGFESYTTHGLSVMDKHATSQINEKASMVLRENNVLIWGAHVYAFPTQTDEDLKITLTGGLKNSDIMRLTMYTPLKGSRVFNELEAAGKLKDIDFEQFDFFHHVVADERKHSHYKIKMIVGLLSYYFYYKTLRTALYSKNKFKTRLIRKAYKGAFLFVFYKFMRMIGLKIL